MSTIGLRATPESIAAFATASGHVDDEARIERRGNDVLGPERRPPAVKGGRDLVGDLGAGELGQRLGRGDLHGVVDGRGLHVERAAEDEGKAQHVVDLVGVVGAPGRHDGVIAHGEDVLGRDLGIGVRHREDDRLGRHARRPSPASPRPSPTARRRRRRLRAPRPSVRALVLAA